jgi:hypothetical protein
LQHISLALLQVGPHSGAPELDDDALLALLLEDEDAPLVLDDDETPLELLDDEAPLELLLDDVDAPLELPPEEEVLPALDEVEVEVDEPLVDPVEVLPEVDALEEVDPWVVVVVAPPPVAVTMFEPQPAAWAAPARRRSERREAG